MPNARLRAPTPLSRPGVDVRAPPRVEGNGFSLFKELGKSGSTCSSNASRAIPAGIEQTGVRMNPPHRTS